MDVVVIFAGNQTGREDLRFHVIEGEYPVVDCGHSLRIFDTAEYRGNARLLMIAHAPHL